jgi:anaerobic selenocysteine-containing dehydrogenase
VVPIDRDVRPFQSVLLDLGARLGLPGMVDEAGRPKYRDYADYMVRHERTPGIGPLAGWRGHNGDAIGKGAPNPDQLKRYVANGGFWHHTLEPEQRYYKMANQSYLDFAVGMGFLAAPTPTIFQLYAEPLQRFRLAARGHGGVLPPARERARLERYFDPLPIWYAPIEDQSIDTAAFPLHAITQRPMHLYHSWGGQNAWLRQITSQNRLFVHRDTAARCGLADDDWAWIESHHGKVKGQIRIVEGVNPDTVWTWNAVGKRSGAGMLDHDAPEAKRGFLLNHAIAQQLPPDPQGRRSANCDPVTGQAAWFDLRVRLRKCAAAEICESAPQLPPLKPPPGLPPGPRWLGFGAQFRRAREAAP